MSDIDLVIRTADRSRKAEIAVDDAQTCGDIIQAAIENWTLPVETDYTITNVSKSPPETLNPSTNLVTAGVEAGETLEIQPVLVAGDR